MCKKGGSSAQHSLESARAVSQREVIELSYEYTIPDFNLLPQETGDILVSPVFFAKSHPNLQWCLQIYPKGDCEETKDRMSVFVARVYQTKKDLPVIARCKFTVFRNGKEIISRWTPPLQFSLSMKNDGWGMPKFLSLDKLESDNNNQQGKEVIVACHLVCEVQRVWVTSFSK